MEKGLNCVRIVACIFTNHNIVGLSRVLKWVKQRRSDGNVWFLLKHLGPTRS